MRVNFGVQKFKKIEDEEMKERKKKEQALNNKKQLLLEQFSEKDELTKNTTKQLDNSAKTDSSVAFKHELDRLIDQTKRQDEELKKLEYKLMQVSNGDYHGSSMFSSIVTGNNNNNRNNLSHNQQSKYRISSSAGQFSRIFSKSYYRSGNVELLGASQMQNKEEIEQYLERLKQEISTSDQNITNENERTMSIQNQLEQLFKTKQKVKRQVLEIESMTEAAGKRFDGMARIEFVAKQKKAIAAKQLMFAKSELTEQDSMRQNIISRQCQQFEVERAGLQSSEEQTGSMMLRIDELEGYLANTKNTLGELLLQEKKILKKRMQSKYILKYIHFFHTFKKIFQGRTVDADQVKNLYDEIQQEQLQNEGNNNHLHHESRNFDDIVKETNAVIIEQQQQQHLSWNGKISEFESPRNIPGELGGNFPENINVDNAIPVSPNEFKRSTIEIPVEEDSATFQRTELIVKINEFINEHNGDLSNCVSSVLRVLNEQRYQQETNNEQYEMLLQAKTQSTQDLKMITEELEQLKKNNPYVEEMKQSIAEELKQESIQEAFDTGYLRLPDSKDHQSNQDSSGNKPDQLSIKNHFTTVNIQRQADGQHQFQLIEKEINANKNFFFNFFMSYGDSLIRLCRVIKTIFKTILQNKPSPQMHKRCQETIKYIQSVWAESERKQDILDHSSMPGIQQQFESALNSPSPQQLNSPQPDSNGRHQPQNSSRGLMLEGLSHGVNNPNNNNLMSMESEVNIYNPQERRKTTKGAAGGIGGKRKIVLEKFTKEETREMFNNAFGSGFNKQADEFYQLLRNDRVVWFFCDNDAVQNYLFERYASSNQDSSIAVQLALDDYSQLEIIAKQESNYKLNEFQNNLTGLITQMRIERQEIEEDLRSKGVNITDNKDQLKYYKQSDNNPNAKITTAIQNVIKRQQEYQYAASEAAAAKEDQQLQVNAIQPLNNGHHHHQILHVKHIDELGKYPLKSVQQSSLKTDTQNDGKQQDMIETDVEFLEIVDYITSIPSSRQREAHKRQYILPPSAVHAHNNSIHQQSSLSNNQTSQKLPQQQQIPAQNSQNTNNPTASAQNQNSLPAQQTTTNNGSNNQNAQQQQQQAQGLPSLQQQSSAAQQQVQQAAQQQQTLQGQQQQQQVQTQQGTQQQQQSSLGGQQNDTLKSNINGGVSGILKKKVAPMKTLEYKSVFDVNEDNFIDEESKKQKDREKQQYLEYLALEKEKEKKSLQIQRELEPNAQFKVIQNLNKRLTSSSSQSNIHQKNLRHFSLSSRVLSKIEFLDRNHNNNQDKEELIAGDTLFSQLQMEKHNIFRDLVKQEQNEKDTVGLADAQKDRIDTDQGTEGDFTTTDLQYNNKRDHHQPLFPPKTLTQTYLKSTAAMEERKKAALRTIRELESQRVKSTTVLQALPSERHAKTSEANKNSRQSSRQMDSKHMHTQSTKSAVSQQNLHQQFVSAQNMKFYARYNEQIPIKETQPQSQTQYSLQRIPQGMGQVQKSQSEHSFKANNTLGKIASPRQQNGLHYRTPHKSEQFAGRLLPSSQTQSTHVNQKELFNYTSGNTNRNPYLPSSGGYENLNFIDFPFFTADPSSLEKNPSGQQLYTPNPMGQMYTPTGLLSNFKASQSGAFTPDNRINYFF